VIERDRERGRDGWNDEGEIRRYISLYNQQGCSVPVMRRKDVWIGTKYGHSGDTYSDHVYSFLNLLQSVFIELLPVPLLTAQEVVVGAVYKEGDRVEGDFKGKGVWCRGTITCNRYTYRLVDR
jgi:hypothetical protein